jgi:opacity protein-like surface antigen
MRPSRRLSFPLTGVNYTLTKHFSLRAEYRGYVYKDADFGIRALNTDSWTHTVQPSAGDKLYIGTANINR